MTTSITGLEAAAIDNSFSGVVAVDVGPRRVFGQAFGFAHRAYGVPNTLDTAFGIASGSKGFTALAVMAQIEAGALALNQPVRDVLGDDLRLIDDSTTIENLLGHTSGIGDYIDEDDSTDWDDYVLSVPTHTLTAAESYLPILEGRTQKFAPGERFAYCNSGYVILALVLERVTGRRFVDLVRQSVFDPAQMHQSGYFRLDDLPKTAATGYLYSQGDRVNTLHLPVLGNGDGGAFATVDDVHRFWRALFSGSIVSLASVDQMIQPRSDVPEEGMRYGLGFWRHMTHNAVILEGSDAGVSFRSTYMPNSDVIATVIGNSTEAGWPLIGLLDDQLSSLVAEA